ncbi:hypothetical protein [Nocardia tengchongensis]|uniref:hypothetical protein n=1 Tax=Nocardia tengchongensis TaxID=2055889 RepID=UPI0036CECDE7
MSIAPSEAATGRVHNFSVRSSADAAQQFARVIRGQDLLASETQPFPGLQPVSAPHPHWVPPFPYKDPDTGPLAPGPDPARIPSSTPEPAKQSPPTPQPAPNSHPSVQPGVTAQPQNSAPSSTKPVQPGVTVQPSQPAPEPEPVLKEATYTGPTMFDIGNNAPPDQAEGQPWVVQDPNLGKITNTIVAGTGGQTVDSTIEKPNGETVTLRRVADGTGGYTMWMNAGGVMSVSYSPGTHGAAPGQILQYTMAEGDDPSSPSIISDLLDGGRTTVNLDTRTGTTWGTQYLDNGEQEVSILSQDQVQKIFRTYHDEMGNPYTEQVGELRPDKTGWYLGTDGLRRDFNPDHSIDVSGMDSARTTARLHYTPSGQVSGTLANDVEARTITITPNDTGSIHVTQDFRGKTLHVTRYDLKGNPLRDWALGSDGKWLDYTRNADGSTTFNQLDGTRLQVKDIWRYTVWSPDGSHKDFDTSPKIDTRSFTQKLWDAGDNAWDAAFEKGRGLVIGLGAMSGFNSQYNDFAKFMGWNSKLETQKIPFTNRDMKLGPLVGLAYGIGTGILKGTFDTLSADLKTAISTAETTGDWMRGKVSFSDAALRVWQEAAFDSINARSQFFLMTDLRGATEHPSQTFGELAFGGATLLLPTKGIGRGIGATTRAGISGAAKVTELANAAVHAFSRSSIADSTVLGISRRQLAETARAATQSVSLGSATAARMMSQTLQKFRTNGSELLSRLPVRVSRTDTPPRDIWIDDSGRTAPPIEGATPYRFQEWKQQFNKWWNEPIGQSGKWIPRLQFPKLVVTTDGMIVFVGRQAGDLAHAKVTMYQSVGKSSGPHGANVNHADLGGQNNSSLGYGSGGSSSGDTGGSRHSSLPGGHPPSGHAVHNLRSEQEGLTTGYRVQTSKSESQRISIDSSGNVSIHGSGQLYVNLSGDISHSLNFRGRDGLIVAFDLPESYVERIRATAVPQRQPREFGHLSAKEWKIYRRTHLEIADKKVGDGLYGIPEGMLDEFQEAIILGSGKVIEKGGS